MHVKPKNFRLHHTLWLLVINILSSRLGTSFLSTISIVHRQPSRQIPSLKPLVFHSSLWWSFLVGPSQNFDLGEDKSVYLKLPPEHERGFVLWFVLFDILGWGLLYISLGFHKWGHLNYLSLFWGIVSGMERFRLVKKFCWVEWYLKKDAWYIFCGSKSLVELRCDVDNARSSLHLGLKMVVKYNCESREQKPLYFTTLFSLLTTHKNEYIISYVPKYTEHILIGHARCVLRTEWGLRLKWAINLTCLITSLPMVSDHLDKFRYICTQLGKLGPGPQSWMSNH